ncbi:scopoletin glucosyltransferase-like [Dorcoceras hygrometricum]|uniref:Scopoletin glucosyltransferase-like n=1 Tax=Dorcoceras hygrometricum TaxID=472368 RepID=A0A2Z6ZS03_9LAMI|nr:scopoletin glucosyltransferase-like [Dorcoceras hygrometricum]
MVGRCVRLCGWTSGASSVRGGCSMIAAPCDGGRPAFAGVRTLAPLDVASYGRTLLQIVGDAWHRLVAAGRRPLRNDAWAGRALVAAACVLAARVISCWRPPAGSRSGEDPEMS